MTKADVIAGLAGKPVPFTVHGLDVLLRPLRYSDRTEAFNWYRDNKDAPNAGVGLQRKLVAMSVCDESGSLLLSEADVDLLDSLKIDAIAKEISRRSGTDGKDEEPGKTLPTTAS
jgi:hypothetical protein